MAGIRGRQDQHLLLLAKRSKARPVPLPLTFSLCFSAQGDELLIECRYQTLDRDTLTFVSAHLPTMVNDNSLKRALPLVLAIPSLRRFQLKPLCFPNGITHSCGASRSHIPMTIRWVPGFPSSQSMTH